MPAEADVMEMAPAGAQSPALPKGVMIGTSGWHYGSWRGPFYPKTIKVKEQLAYYTGRFPTAEITDSFYRLPTQKAVADWLAAAPEGFVFAWKASRYVTHFKRLKDCQEGLAPVFERMRGLGGRLGPVLFQLPPQLHADRDRLAGFLKLLPRDGRHAFEFRHASWYDHTVFDVLRDYNAALCISDNATAPSPVEATADFVYLRGHGPGEPHQGSYADSALDALSESIREWHGAKREVFVYFDNDQKSQAPKDADRLIARLAP